MQHACDEAGMRVAQRSRMPHQTPFGDDAGRDVPPDILVVDDHDDTRNILRDYFEAHGLRVREAADGVEAIAQLEAGRPDVVVLDVRMPRLSGIAVVQVMRASERLRRVPVLAYSAYALVEEVRKIREAGVDAYLAKPSGPDDVLTAVRQLLEYHRLPSEPLIQSDPSVERRPAEEPPEVS